jgi:drug/metabolite transporter (DMT)-like permease
LLGEQIGVFATIGIVFGVPGLLGLLPFLLGRKAFPSQTFLREPGFYLRWGTFVIHELALNIAVRICERDHLPFVILLNYLWPTTILVCSILFGGLRITRRWAFVLGTVIVIGSLGAEILAGKDTDGLFSKSNDQLAYLLALIAALSWGIYSAITRRLGGRAGGRDVVALFQISLALVYPLSLLAGYSVDWNLELSGTSLLLVYCFFMYLAYQCWDHGMQYGNVVIISLGADFIPWLSLGAAAVLLGIPLEFHTIVSAVTLVVGAMVTRFGTLPRPVT